MKPLEAMIGNAQKADAVAIASVKSVGPAPGAWSGLFAAYQEVQYQVVRWLRKPAHEIQGDSLVVRHPVVAKSLTADEHHPQLRGALFRPGAELILFLHVKDSGMETADENYGVAPNDPKTEEAVTHALAQRPQPQPAK